MALGKGKKRVMMTLTVANVERFQRLASEFNLPSNQMSKTCDDTIREMCEMLEKTKEAGTLTVEDLFRLMGREVQLLIEEEKKGNVEYKKRKKAQESRNKANC